MTEHSAPPVAVVTGGASGIGLETSQLLATRGYTVVIGDINLEGATSTAKAISAAGGTAQAFELDLADDSSITAFREQAVDALGAPTLIANVAGWDMPGPFLENTDEYRRKVIDINLLGPIKIAQEFLNAMVTAGVAGRVVNIASDAGRVGSSSETVYSAAKGGIIAFTKSLAREMARHKITVNCVAPGPTDTPLFQHASEKLQAALIRAIPLRRLAQPEEIAAVIAFFGSDEAEYITGQVLSVSGGLTMCD